MPKLSWNKFLDQHKGGPCIEFAFVDYATLQASLRRVRAKGQRVIRTGKTLPPPNAVITKMAKDMVKGGGLRQLSGVARRSLGPPS
jgi:hypothetical protein